ncbi:MAG: YraN family protein [Clostridiales bacterium]|nr:YraN family protein [Butyricicoccus pullicaecorum]MCI6720436.1 YraN family protein [Clostridiales bacterium]
MTRGAWGEAVAAAYLRKKGYRIVQQNFSTRFGEIDLIVQDARYIVFVEVKTRKSDRFGAAREAVDLHKQRRLIATAEQWLQRNPTNLQPRFDVVEIYGEEDLPVRSIEHIENAFDA